MILCGAVGSEAHMLILRWQCLSSVEFLTERKRERCTGGIGFASCRVNAAIWIESDLGH